MSPLFLSSHVYLCRTDEGLIFLDLRKNSYSAITNSQMRGIHPALTGWPLWASSSTTESNDAADSDAETLISELLQRGLLTTDAKTGKPAAPTDFRSATETLHDDQNGIERWFRASHLIRFLCACFIAKSLLRLLSLERIARRLRLRNMRSQIFSTPELAQIRELLCIYMRLRPLVFTAKDACLFDSLALLEFLSMYRVFPTWVVGVRTAPFSAHSWVQYDHYVLNENAEYVRTFTPIMAL